MTRGRYPTCFGWCVLLSACNFDHGSLLRDGDVAPASDTGDAPGLDTRKAFCAADPDLVACYEFEGSATDASPNMLHPTMANVSFVTGRQGMAVQVSATSALDVAENPALDVPYLTIEAWIYPTEIPAVRSGIVDNTAQYSLYLYAGGDLRCCGFQLAAQIQPNRWTHVACTYDGAAHVWVDGIEVGASSGGGGPLPTTGTTGISIASDNPPGSGQQLIGRVDQLRIYEAPRTAQQICAAAGRTSCP